MSDMPLLDWTPPPSFQFKGATFEPSRDATRLSKQLKAVHDIMGGGRKFTLRALADAADAPEASVSARYRDLKRLGFPMMKENLGDGCWLYWMDCND